MRYIAILFLALSATLFAQTKPQPNLPTSAEGSITCAGNNYATDTCTSYSGTVMTTSFPTQGGATTNVSTTSQLTTALTGASCGDTIVLQAGTTFVVPSGGLILPSKASGGSGWIVLETSDLSTLNSLGHSEHNRIFFSPTTGGPATYTQIQTILPHMATLKGFHHDPNGTSANVLQYNSDGGCGYRLVGLELYPDFGGTQTNYANGQTLLNEYSSGIVRLTGGDHLVFDRDYIHGFDDIGWPVTNVSITSNVATLTAGTIYVASNGTATANGHYMSVGDTLTLRGFGTATYLNDQTVTITAVGTRHGTTGSTSATQLAGSKTVTVTATNNFSVGDYILATGLFPSGVSSSRSSGVWQVATASGSQFTYTVLQSYASTQTTTGGTFIGLSSSFSFAFTHADTTTADSGFALDSNAPNTLGTGIRQDTTRGIFVGWGLTSNGISQRITGSSFIAVVDSYISEIHGGPESQTMLGSSASDCLSTGVCQGPIKLVNNFLSAAGENVMFGGAGTNNNTTVTPPVAAPAAQPHDIEVRNNYLWADPNWFFMGAINSGYPVFWVMKDNFECKSCQRIMLDGNILANAWSWGGAGDLGTGFRVTVRGNSSGQSATTAANTVVDDVVVHSNFFLNQNSAFSELGNDTACTGNIPYCWSYGEGQRHLFENNLMVLHDPGLYPLVSGYSSRSGMYASGLEGIQLAFGAQNIEVVHNTIWYVPNNPNGVVNSGNNHGINWNLGQGPEPYSWNFLFHGQYAGAAQNLCLGSGYHNGDTLTLTITGGVCTVAPPTVTISGTGSGGCVTAAPWASGNGSKCVTTSNVATTTSGSGTGFTVDVQQTQVLTSQWLLDNVWFSPIYADFQYTDTAAFQFMLPNDSPWTTQLAGNMVNIYSPNANQTLYNRNCTSGAINDSNCTIQSGSTLNPASQFAFVNTSAYNYGLVTTYNRANSVLSTPAGADFGSTSSSVLNATATTFTGQNCGTIPIIQTTSLPATSVNASYSVPISIICGGGTYTLRVQTGDSLPGGLSISGLSIVGTPTTQGTTTFHLIANDGTNDSAPQLESITVNAQLTITTTTLPSGAVSEAYSGATINATGGVTPYAYSVSVGTLPSGLSLGSGSGAITGTPTGPAQTYNFTVKVTGFDGSTATQALSIVVNGSLQITGCSLPTGTQNAVYTGTCTATGGLGTHSWSVSSGTLCTGLSLSNTTSATVTISGTPTVVQTCNFTLSDTDGTATATFPTSITINAASGTQIVVTTTQAQVVNGMIGYPYPPSSTPSLQFTASSGTAPYTWAIIAGAVPTGMQFTSGGFLGGTPTVVIANQSFTVQATDNFGDIPGVKTFTITISPIGGVSLNGAASKGNAHD